MGEHGNAYKALTRKREGQDSGTNHSKIKLNLREIGWECVDWTHLLRHTWFHKMTWIP